MNSKQCYKCKKPVVSVHTRHHYACKECFCESVNKYFRAQLNKLKIPRMANVVLAYSGGSCSSAMVSLFYDALTRAKSRMSYNVSLVFISFDVISDLLGIGSSVNVTSLSKEYGYPLTIIPAEMHPLFQGDKEKLHTFFSQMKSLDSKYDMMKLIENQLLIQHTSSLSGPWYLLFGYTMDHYTEQVVHAMSNNLGFSMAYYHTCSKLYSVPNTEVFIGSPLSDLTSREISIYCHYRKVEYETSPSFLHCKGDSVYRLALDMVEGLQDECDSTLHIVTETCGKLQECPVVMSSQAKLCKLCKEYCEDTVCSRCKYLMKEDGTNWIKEYIS